MLAVQIVWGTLRWRVYRDAAGTPCFIRLNLEPWDQTWRSKLKYLTQRRNGSHPCMRKAYAASDLRFLKESERLIVELFGASRKYDAETAAHALRRLNWPTTILQRLLTVAGIAHMRTADAANAYHGNLTVLR
jgi:hypothetical protein